MTVFLVGSGPGDPGLITVRGLDLVRRAEVLVLDRLAGTELPLEVPEGCLVIDAGKAPGRVAMTQDEINACLVEHGLAGRMVVRLKGGDPFVFGRGSEEAEALRAAGVRYEVVPGVTSAIAAPSAGGIPVTHRGLATHVTIVTGHEDPAKAETQTDWAALARAGGTLVLLMGVGRLGAIAEALIAGGRAPTTPVGIVERGTLPTQRVTTGTLATIAATAEAAGVRSPAVTVVGDVVAVRDAIGWTERLPLAGRSIAITRARAQADGLTRRLADLGARVVNAPLIRTEPVAGDPIDAARYDLVVVTSPNAPRVLLDRIGGDARALAGVEVAAIGPATAAALREIGIVADVVSERAVAEGLLDLLADRAAGRRVLIARAEEARDLLPEGLAQAGAEVEIAVLYRTVPVVPDSDAALGADAVAFTSASTARAFAAAFGDHDLDQVRGVSIGPATSAALRELGIPVALEAAEHDLDGLVAALIELLG
ncbi:MAG: uroporphyrinogen-III C-methyltransferase [Gaiellales bacterium]